MTTVLKLGGSVITEKDGVEKIDAVRLGQAVDIIAHADVSQLVLVHGGGSFGHHHANKYDVSTTHGTHDPDAVLDIHEAMKRLNEVVVHRLNETGVAAVPVHTFSTAARDADATLTLGTTAIEALLEEDFVPVLHGDVIAHEGKGVTVVSGDELVTELARSLDADRVGLCSGVPGVLDESNNVIPEITNFEAVAAALGGSDTTDVSGGMAGKVRELLSLGAPADIFGLDGLAAFLSGEAPGTRIDGRTD